MNASRTKFQIWTIGHSTRTAGEFLELLDSNGIETIADVRRFTGSRKYPHFGQEALKHLLNEDEIEYEAFPSLGGRRKPRADSRNTVWRNASFRGYADHMETPEFAAGMEMLAALARRRRTAIMCAEAVWWRCHRALIADRLKASGNEVLHILGVNNTVPHPYTAAAQVHDGRLSYSGHDPSSL